MGIVVFALEVLNLILIGNAHTHTHKKGVLKAKKQNKYITLKKQNKISEMERPCCTISEAQCYTLRL